MRPLLVAGGAGLILLSLSLVPASASTDADGCRGFAASVITPFTPVSCGVEVTCQDVSDCTYRVYLDTEAGGATQVAAFVDGQQVASCGPGIGVCGITASFTVPAHATVQVRCTTGALAFSLMAELDCNLDRLS